ncbi:MAG: hypothetical protein V3V33_01895 [Candidatus Lokiarchaeia archaeon]
MKIPIEAKPIVSKAGSNSKIQYNMVKIGIIIPKSKYINESRLISFPLQVLIEVIKSKVIEIKAAPNRRSPNKSSCQAPESSSYIIPPPS